MTPRIIPGRFHALVVEPCQDPLATEAGAVQVRWATAGEMLQAAAVTAEWTTATAESAVCK